MSRPPDTTRRLELATRAAEILARDGLGLSTEALASALGVKRPTLLYHFPTHGHVIETALVALMSEQAVAVMAALERHEDPIDRLFAQMKAVHAFHAGREHRIVFLTQAVATLGGDRGQAIVERAVEVFAAQRRAAADRIRAGIAQGIVAPCDADALVSAMRALTDGLMVQRVTDRLDVAAAHAFVWEHVLAPLKRAPRAERAQALESAPTRETNAPPARKTKRREPARREAAARKPAARKPTGQKPPRRTFTKEKK